MSQYTRAQFETLYGTAATSFPDNTTGAITELIMRTFGKDLSDSFFNKSTDLTPVSTDTTGATITLNFANNPVRNFFGSASFATAKAIAHSNAGNAVKYDFMFEITNTNAKLTFPAGYIMSDVRWEQTNPQEWEPAETGKYKATATYDGTNWWLEISASPYV
jgi:hypothetical protein